MSILKSTFISCFGIFLCLFSACKKESFTKSGMAMDHFYLKSGNLHMPVTVAGNMDAKKMVIVIHGGPGGNSMAYRDAYVKDVVEKELVMVYWGQRYAGYSQGNSGDISLAEFRQDIKNLLVLLKEKYGSDKRLYLMGHSWGGFLAPYFLAHESNQSLVKGWIQVDGAHNFRLNDSLTREYLMAIGADQLIAGENTEFWTEVVDWCKINGFEDYDDIEALNKFAHKAETNMAEVYKPENISSGISFPQVSSWANLMSSGLKGIYKQTYAQPTADQLKKIVIPTLLMWGKYDFVCPPQLVEDIEKHIGSKKSEVSKIIYEHSGHSPMMNERKLFWADFLSWVKVH